MKIPAKAKLVFKGTIFDVYHWQQKLYDGRFATFEALKRPNTIQIVPIFKGKILISLEKQPGKSKSFTLFGGRQEEGEKPLEAAKRELLEETGLSSKKWTLLKIFPYEGKIDWTTYLFVARDCEKLAEPNLDGGELIEVKMCSFDKFIDIVSREDFWGQFFTNYILRLRLNPKALNEFKASLLN